MALLLTDLVEHHLGCSLRFSCSSGRAAGLAAIRSSAHSNERLVFFVQSRSEAGQHRHALGEGPAHPVLGLQVIVAESRCESSRNVRN
jgi:hypothetical protein